MTEEDQIETEPVGELMDRLDEAMRVQLPCGHMALFPANYIHTAPATDLWSAVCDACSKRIMGRKDYMKLRMYYARLKRYDWEDKMAQWIGKHSKVRNDSRLVELKSEALIESLLQAQASFVMPMTMNPRTLCPTTQPESRALLVKITEALKAHVTLPIMTPKQLFRNLEELAWKLIKESFAEGGEKLMVFALPPGFERFVIKWLTRAVNHAVGSQAEEESDQEMMDLLQKMQKTNIDPKAAAVGSDLDDILKQIGETKLEERLKSEQGEQTGDDDEEL